jgi:hypothetical protein
VQCRFDTHTLSDTHTDANSDAHPYPNTDACSIDLGG